MITSFGTAMAAEIAGLAGMSPAAGILSLSIPPGVAVMMLGLAVVLAAAIVTGHHRHPPNPSAAIMPVPADEIDEEDWKEAA